MGPAECHRLSDDMEFLGPQIYTLDTSEIQLRAVVVVAVFSGIVFEQVCGMLCAGESLVPEQTNEVETHEGRADGTRQGDRSAQANHRRTAAA